MIINKNENPPNIFFRRIYSLLNFCGDGHETDGLILDLADDGLAVCLEFFGDSTSEILRRDKVSDEELSELGGEDV